MLSLHQSPLIVSASAASRLPRWALLIVLATLALAGLGGHYFWNARDEQVFGLIWSMASGGWDLWSLPAIAGEPYAATGPAIAWAGALLVRLTGGFASPILVAKASGLIWFILAAGSVWYATWHLARRDEAQPVPLLFSEEASPRDYSRTVADAAALLFVASFGLFARLHEIGLPIVILACWALGLAGTVWSLPHKKAGPAVAGAAAGLLALCGSLVWAAPLLASSLLGFLFVKAFKDGRVLRVVIATVCALAVFALWPLAALAAGASLSAWSEAFEAVQAAALAAPRLADWSWLLRNFIWYLCPMWPFAAYAVYAWRRVIGRPQTMLPLIASGCALSTLLFASGPAENSLIAAAPAVAALASFGLASVKKGAWKNFLDWFSATIFTLAAVALWAYYIAWCTGYPPKMAASVARLAPSVVPWAEGSLLFMTAAAGLLWLGIVAWRLVRRPKALWRGPWLATLGITLIWVTGTALFSGWLDAYRSNAPVAREIAGKLRIFGYVPGDCVAPDGIPTNLRGLLGYAGVRFDEKSGTCRFMLSRSKEGLAAPEDKIGIPSAFAKEDDLYYLRPGSARPLNPAARPETDDDEE